MKILTLSNLYPPDILGGYELNCRQAVDALRARGHAVEVLAAKPRMLVADEPHIHRWFDLTDEWSRAKRGDDPFVRRIRLAESRLVNAFNVRVLTRALEAFAPEAVYVHNVVGLGGLGLIACLQYLGVPWVWHLEDHVPRELCSTEDGVDPRLAAQFSAAVRGTFTVVSRRVLNACQVEGLVLNGRVELLPGWIAGPRPAPRTRFYRGGVLRVMSAGRVCRAKGAHIILKAVALARDAGYDAIRVDAYGAIADPSIPLMIHELRLEDRIRLMGPRPQEELLRLYGDYDMFVFPTHHGEPFGLVPLEAASRGCVPVITADCGVSEWLVHGVHCLKAERTPEEFASAFLRVLRGEVALEPLARRAGEAAWADFHIDVHLPRIEGQLRDAALRGRAGHRRGTPAEAYRLARMAEQLTQALIQESLCA
jgi:glycosyltransferase involved in cell wall biosynthesis